MADYRVYCLEGDGSIGFAEWIRAESDEDAVAEAQRLKPEVSRCEVWQGSRLVARLNAAGGFEACTA